MAAEINILQRLPPVEEAKFWNQERTEVLRSVYQMVDLMYATWGGDDPSSTPLPTVVVVNNENTQFGAAYYPALNTIFLEYQAVKSSKFLADLLSHELVESRARHRFSHTDPSLAFIDEAVIEVTSLDVLSKIDENLKFDLGYNKARVATETMCREIANVLPDEFPSTEVVFGLLQSAIFKGEHDEFWDIFEQVYGSGKRDLLISIADFGRWAGDDTLSDTSNGNAERYKWLLRFLGGEEVSLEEIEEAIASSKRKRYSGNMFSRMPPGVVPDSEEVKVRDILIGERFTINGNTVNINYSLASGVRLINDGDNTIRGQGLKGKIVDHMIYLSSGGGYPLLLPGLYIGESDIPTQGYPVKERDIEMRQVDNATHRILIDALGEPTEIAKLTFNHKPVVIKKIPIETSGVKAPCLIYVYPAKKVKNESVWKPRYDEARVYMRFIDIDEELDWWSLNIRV